MQNLLLNATLIRWRMRAHVVDVTLAVPSSPIYLFLNLNYLLSFSGIWIEWSVGFRDQRGLFYDMQIMAKGKPIWHRNAEDAKIIYTCK